MQSPSPRLPTRPFAHLLICLLLLALIPRLLYLASIPQEAILESVDAQGYDLLARNLRAGHGFSLQDTPPYTPDGLRTPLYPLFVAAVYGSLGSVGDLRPTSRTGAIAVAVAQATLDSLTALLVGAIAGALLGRRAGVVAALLYALTPVQWRYAAALLTEIPLAFLTSLAVWLLIRFISDNRDPVTASNPQSPISNPQSPIPNIHSRHAVACGGVAGLAALCKPNVGGLALILASVAFWALREQRRRALVGAGAIVLTAAAVMSPWLIRNWAVFGRPFLSNAWLGYVARVTAPATLGVVEGHQVPPWSPPWEARYHAVATRAATRYGWTLEPPAPLSPREADRREREIAQVAIEVILAHPWAAARAHLVGFIRSWAPQEQTFWYAHLTGRPWETTGVAANTFRDAVEILCAGRPVEAFQFAFIQPWERLDPFGRLLWCGWGLGHLLAGGLMLLGLWQLRRQPALALVLAATILYATLPAGPIGYVRFRVPVVPLITVLEVAGAALPVNPLRGILALPRTERDTMTINHVEGAREKAYILYEGRRLPHHSCGICIAATFGLPTRPFQALRKGGVTGEGECGAIVAGRLVLGYFLGDPDPTGPLRPELLEAMEHYEKLWQARTEPGQALTRSDNPDIVCNTLVGHLADDFWGQARMGYCARLAAEVAACAAETLEKFGVPFEIEPLP